MRKTTVPGDCFDCDMDIAFDNCEIRSHSWRPLSFLPRSFDGLSLNALVDAPFALSSDDVPWFAVASADLF